VTGERSGKTDVSGPSERRAFGRSERRQISPAPRSGVVPGRTRQAAARGRAPQFREGLGNGRESSDRTKGLSFGFWCWRRWPKKVAVNYRENPYGVIGLAGAKDRRKACGKATHGRKGRLQRGAGRFFRAEKSRTGQEAVGVPKRGHRRAAKQRFT